MQPPYRRLPPDLAIDRQRNGTLPNRPDATGAPSVTGRPPAIAVADVAANAIASDVATTPANNRRIEPFIRIPPLVLVLHSARATSGRAPAHVGRSRRRWWCSRCGLPLT